MKPQEIEDAAQALFEAETTRRQIGLLSLKYPTLDLDGAYALQAALIRRKQAAGRKVIGWKIGLTSRAMQQALKIETPDSGVLLDDMLFEDGAAIPADRFIEPRIEAEIAFVMKAPLQGLQVTREDVLEATEFVAPSLEILDTRIQRSDPASGRPRVITDTVSDNAANAGVVLGAQRHSPQDIDLRWVAAIVKRNGIVEETGVGAGVLDDPATSVLWLIHRLAQYGLGVEAGQILLSGSFIRPIEAPLGSHFVADFGSFGSVSIQF